MQSARWLRKLAPADFRPYNERTMMAVAPASSLNSGPNTHHIFSDTGAVRYAVLTFQSFRAARVKAILTDSLDTTLVYISVFGASVM
jgi:hypothetical protein